MTQTEKLSNPSLSSSEMMEAGNELYKTVDDLETKTLRWMELAELDQF